MKVYGRGPLDLTKRLEDLKSEVETYKHLVKDVDKLKWRIQELETELAEKDILIEGFKKIIQDI